MNSYDRITTPTKDDLNSHLRAFIAHLDLRQYVKQAIRDGLGQHRKRRRTCSCHSFLVAVRTIRGIQMPMTGWGFLILLAWCHRHVMGLDFRAVEFAEELRQRGGDPR